MVLCFTQHYTKNLMVSNENTLCCYHWGGTGTILWGKWHLERKLVHCIFLGGEGGGMGKSWGLVRKKRFAEVGISVSLFHKRTILFIISHIKNNLVIVLTLSVEKIDMFHQKAALHISWHVFLFLLWYLLALQPVTITIITLSCLYTGQPLNYPYLTTWRLQAVCHNNDIWITMMLLKFWPWWWLWWSKPINELFHVNSSTWG